MAAADVKNNDSVPLVPPKIVEKEPRLTVSSVKLFIVLFVIFIIVVSDVFTNSVISKFGDSAVVGRSPTAWGTVLQGIFLVIFYIIAIYLTEHNIL
jgi:hypothetical protein